MPSRKVRNRSPICFNVITSFPKIIAYIELISNHNSSFINKLRLGLSVKKSLRAFSKYLNAIFKMASSSSLSSFACASARNELTISKNCSDFYLIKNLRTSSSKRFACGHFATTSLQLSHTTEISSLYALFVLFGRFLILIP